MSKYKFLSIISLTGFIMISSSCKKDYVAPVRVLNDSTCVLNSISGNGLTSTYNYNSNNLLSTNIATFSIGSSTIKFEYDSQGRVAKTILTTILNSNTATLPTETYYIIDSFGKLTCTKSFLNNKISDSTVFYKIGNKYIREAYILKSSLLYLSSKFEYIYNGQNLETSIQKNYKSSGQLQDSTFNSYSGYDSKLNPFFKLSNLYGYPELSYYSGFSKNNNTSSSYTNYYYRTTGLEITTKNSTTTSSYNHSGSLSQIQDQTTKNSTYFGYSNCD